MRASRAASTIAARVSSGKGMPFKAFGLDSTPDDGTFRLRTHLGMAAEIGGADRFIAPELVWLAAEHDAAGLQHIAVIGHRQPHARVLPDQQNGRVAPDLL